VLVMQLGKGALLLGLDLGAGFLAEVRFVERFLHGRWLPDLRVAH
jgi:hypothetical protein